MVPIDKVLKQSTYVNKDKAPGEKVRDLTIDKYVRFMEVLAENKQMTTSDVYALVKEMKINAEMKPVLTVLGLIITVGREVVWEDTIVPTRGLAIQVAQYINAKVQKKELPKFDIEHYRNAPIEDTVGEHEETTTHALSVEVKPTDKMVSAVVKKEEVVVKPQATLESGNTADINMLLAQEIIAKGGDKALALKLMRNEI